MTLVIIAAGIDLLGGQRLRARRRALFHTHDPRTGQRLVGHAPVPRRRCRLWTALGDVDRALYPPALHRDPGHDGICAGARQAYFRREKNFFTYVELPGGGFDKLELPAVSSAIDTRVCWGEMSPS